MKVICVDDERDALEAAAREVRKIADVTQVETFLSPQQALAAVSSLAPDAALLDIDMGAMDGLSLARRIREQSPRTRIIFLTGYAQYAVDAFKLHVAGYLLKPALKEDIEAELRHIRQHPILRPEGKRLRVQCFGNFEVFAQEKPMKFGRSKTKELFAYLIDRRGAAVNTGELCAVLWEDRPDSISLRNQLRNLLSDLSHSLAAVGAADVLLKRRNSFAVAVEAVDCDYYRFLQREAAAVNQYGGEYMSQYSWAEMRLGALAR